jgi:hypothetical protein
MRVNKPLVTLGEVFWFAGMFLTWAIVADKLNDPLIGIVIWAAATAGVAGLCVSICLLGSQNQHVSGILFALILAAAVCGVTAVTGELAGPVEAAVALGLTGTGLLAVFTIYRRAKDWATKGMVVSGIGVVIGLQAFIVSAAVKSGVSAPMGVAWSLCLLGACCVAIATEPPNPFEDLYAVGDGRNRKQ